MSWTGCWRSSQRRRLPDPLLPRHVYVYVNRRGDHLKALYWDRTGFCLWAKRLERGQFVGDWRRAPGGELDVTGLKLLLEGIEPVRRRLRYRLGATPSQAR